MNNLSSPDKKSNKQEEIEILRKFCKQGELIKVKLSKLDVYLEGKDGEIYLIDLKTAKPNKGAFQGFKRTLLEWTATVLFENPKAKINTLIAIPYNPYEPKPYNRWTMAGMLDLEKELKVAEKFWDFMGGEGAYNYLLDCFEKVGVEMREEIDNSFIKFKCSFIWLSCFNSN